MRTQRTDSGVYNRPAQVQAPAAYADDGQGGNSNANQWTIVRSPMIRLLQPASMRNLFSRLYQYSQLYPDATHFATMRYASDVTIDATMRLLVSYRTFQIIGAEDVDLENVTTILALVEYQTGGSQ